MKLIVPVYDNNRIAEGFSKTPNVCLFDPSIASLDEACTFTSWSNLIPHGTKIAGRMKELGIGNVLAPQIQLLALNLFVENGIHVYKSEGSDLIHNLSLYCAQKLVRYTTTDALENSNICSGSCSDCSDTCSTNEK
ncbi:MAG: hypothetical protein WCQ86_00685 [Bacteroidaceae bacterium]